MRTVIYPGSFNPITNGHTDLVARALNLFDHVVVAIGTSAQKDPAVDLKDRIDLCRVVLAEFGELHPRVLEALDVKGPAVGFAIYLAEAPFPKVQTATRPALDLKAVVFGTWQIIFRYFLSLDEIVRGLFQNAEVLRHAHGKDKENARLATLGEECFGR